MYGYEQRDRSGSMDVDHPDQSDHDPLERFAQFSLPSSEDTGPSRKRPHTDVSTPITTRHFHTHAHASSSGPMHVTSDQPFLFQLGKIRPPPQPPAKSFCYNPKDWASTEFNFGFGGVRPKGGVEDVDMSMGADSPRRPDPTTNSGNGSTQTNGVVTKLGEEMGNGVTAGVKEGKEGTSYTSKGAGGTDTGSVPEERPIASGAVSRVRRKRQKEWRRRAESDTDHDERPTELQPLKSEHQHHYNLHVPTPVLTHSEIPAVLLGYLQFFVNAAIVIFCVFLVIQFVLTVKRDVKDRMQEHSIELLQEIAECTNLYLTNRCDPTLRVPAMEAACKAWEICMNRDPTRIGRIDVVAETFAGVINSFVDPISWKTMGFTLVTLSFLVILTNSAFFNLRSRARHDPPPNSHAQPAMYPPQHYLQPNHNPFPAQHPQSHIPPHQLYPQESQTGGDGSDNGQIGWKGKKGWW